MKWKKGRQTKYKHLYIGNDAVCGSPTHPWPPGSFEHVFFAPKCPKCLKYLVDKADKTEEQCNDN